jgi:uncharacterized membrane protein YfcA
VIATAAILSSALLTCCGSPVTAGAPNELGSIDLAVWASVAPAQAVAAWFGARLAQRVAADNLSRIMAVALLATGAVMLRSSVTGR